MQQPQVTSNTLTALLATPALGSTTETSAVQTGNRRSSPRHAERSPPSSFGHVAAVDAPVREDSLDKLWPISSRLSSMLLVVLARNDHK